MIITTTTLALLAIGMEILSKTISQNQIKDIKAI